jgi:hypothetical protein
MLIGMAFDPAPSAHIMSELTYHQHFLCSWTVTLHYRLIFLPETPYCVT